MVNKDGSVVLIVVMTIMNHNNKLSPGDTVYWCTYSGNKNRRWNHYGTLEQADANHPNHS